MANTLWLMALKIAIEHAHMMLRMLPLFASLSVSIFFPFLVFIHLLIFILMSFGILS